MTTATRWEQMWLPLRPYATDDFLTGLYRMSRPDALQRRYVEANPVGFSNLLVVDVDHPDAALRAVSTVGHHPMPNVVVTNPANGHAHAVWALAEPVTRTEYAHRTPLAYAAAVTEGLRRALDGDRGYSGLITKNPLSDSWAGEVITDELRSLDDLASGLGDLMPPRDWRRTKARRADPIGLGRNCFLFETARTWAYREARRIRQHHEHATEDDLRLLLAAINVQAAEINASFSEPLPASEVRACAASIHRWIVRRFYGWTDSRTVNEATFSAIQSARGRRPRPKRREASAARWDDLA